MKKIAVMACAALLLVAIACTGFATYKSFSWTIPSDKVGYSPSTIYQKRDGASYNYVADVQTEYYGGQNIDKALSCHMYARTQAKQVTSRLVVPANGLNLSYLSSSYISSSSETFKPVTYKARSADAKVSRSIRFGFNP